MYVFSVMVSHIKASSKANKWLKKVNDPAFLGDDLFAFGISYNHPHMGASTTGPLYNGNISETLWRTANDVPGGQTRGYAYRYDALNRIKNADYGIRTTGTFDLNTGYDMGVGAYDKNGNIESLTRQGAGGTVIDQLSYTYWDGGTSNRLRSVDDAAGSGGFRDGYTGTDDYYHDANGNMSRMANKGVMIGGVTYNHLDLPTQIDITVDKGDGTGTIHYIYGADGTKLEKIVNGTTGTDTTQYAGGYIYRDGALQFFNTDEGYAEPIDGSDVTLGFKYVYQYKDHLGDIGLSYSDTDSTGVIDPSTEILDEKNYYPFGGIHEGYNTDVNDDYHPYGYNGKEESNHLGLSTLDFGARNYEPWIGRWMNVDPLAEEFPSWSPYNFKMNNPLRYVDPDGRAPVDWIKILQLLLMSGKMMLPVRVAHLRVIAM